MRRPFFSSLERFWPILDGYPSFATMESMSNCSEKVSLTYLSAEGTDQLVILSARLLKQDFVSYPERSSLWPGRPGCEPQPRASGRRRVRRGPGNGREARSPGGSCPGSRSAETGG